jgi:hypothetical protein
LRIHCDIAYIGATLKTSRVLSQEPALFNARFQEFAAIRGNLSAICQSEGPAIGGRLSAVPARLIAVALTAEPP